MTFRHPRWKTLWIAAGWTAACARFAAADVASTLDDDWYAAVARAESLLAETKTATDIDSLDRAAVAEQIRLGVYVLGSLVRASTSADSLLAGRFAAAQTEPPPSRRWGGPVAKLTRVLIGATTLLPLMASMGHASPQTQRVLAYVGSSVAGIGSIFHGSRTGSESDPRLDSITRIRTVGLESELHDAVQQNERTAESLWQDLRGIALDSCATSDQIVSLARRYANALTASEVLISGMARSSALARSGAEHPGFEPRARERFGALASHLEAIRDLWQERRWLFERSRRNALDYLVLMDRR